ncbi:MAG: maleylacetoacetate isomerase [Trichocoleus desertorum ATA4-8-CV12]|jgi:maleylpyruvate isomerase|nr:maleylacetoacetate isomerase [Trichocoleus desertorum ATA4-8-CV12]
MKLYSFFRSSTSHRLRIALNLKRIPVEYVAIDLRKEEHLEERFKLINPQALVPVLALESNETLIQSPSIIEWLEEEYPAPPLLPQDPIMRAKVRALTAIVGCDIHPLNNRRILEYLRQHLGADESSVQAWCEKWIIQGFDAIESLLAEEGTSGPFCFGDTLTLADVYLIPQIESARRFKISIDRWPLISAIDRYCAEIEEFRSATPKMQPDFG